MAQRGDPVDQARRRGSLAEDCGTSDAKFQGRVLILTVCAAGIGGTFQYGYNLTIINAPTVFIQTFMNETWLERTGTPLAGRVITLIWSFIVSVYPLGGLIGALIAGPMAIKLGRKKSLLLNNIFVVFAALLVGFSRMAKSFEMILLSRFFAGINSGVSMNVQPMYLGESAPRELRGAIALTSASFTALGLVLGQIIGLREILGAEENWPLLLATNVVPGLIQLLLLPWAPESPRYLLIDQGDQESCISALRRLRGNDDLSSEMKEMLAEQMAVQGMEAKAPWELFQNPAARGQLITIVVLSSAMQLCGNDSMYFYASYIFQEAGIPYDKIQYSIIGTGSCELITAVTCEGLGYYCYLPFFTVCVCTAVYVGFFLPETKGKTFLEISEEFNKRYYKAQTCENSWTHFEEIKSTTL